MDSQTEIRDIEQATSEQTTTESGREASSPGAVPGDIAAAAAATASGAEAPVQLAQAMTAEATHIAAPPPGERTVVPFDPTQTYVFDFARADAELVIADGDLVILVAGGGEIIIENYVAGATQAGIPPLNFAGETIGAFDLLSQVATAEQLAEIAPAAAAPAGPLPNTGAAFAPNDPGDQLPGINDLGPQAPTELAFAAPEPFQRVFPEEGVEELAPAAAPPFLCQNFALPFIEALFEDVLEISKDDLVIPGSAFFDQIIPHGSGFHEGDSGNDHIFHDYGGPNVQFYGDGGDDLLVGGDGNDRLNGGPDHDTLIGGDGNDYGYGGLGNDWLDGGGHNDTLVGGEGNDTIFGSGGFADDLLVGDIWGVEQFVFLGAYAYGAGDESLANFNDYLDGGNGDDTLVGDVFVEFSGLHLGAGAYGGSDTVFAFNDTLRGGEGSDLLVGDVLSKWSGRYDSIELGAGAYGGSAGGNHFVAAFNDFLATDDDVFFGVPIGAQVEQDRLGDPFSDTLVGDVMQAYGGQYSYVSLFAEAYGGGADTVIAFNDQLIEGDNILNLPPIFIGPVLPPGPTSEQLGGSGDLLVGDVYQAFGQWGNTYLSTFAGGEGAGTHIVGTFNDLLEAGDDVVNVDIFLGPIVGAADVIDGPFAGFFNDTLVGDVYQRYTYSQVNIDVRSYGGGPEDSPGSHKIGAHSDTILGGDDVVNINVFGYGYGFGTEAQQVAPIGAEGFFGDVLVGDVYQVGSHYNNRTDIDVSAYGGGDHVVFAFNDEIRAGDRTINILGAEGFTPTVTSALGGEGFAGDTLVGDVYQIQESYDGSVDIDVIAGAEGGTNHICSFNDTLIAGVAMLNVDYGGEGVLSEEIPLNHLLVGDVYMDHAGDDGSLDIDVHFYGGYGGGSGHLIVFNDEVVSGIGDDTLVGDVFMDHRGSDGSIDIDIVSYGGGGYGYGGVGEVGGDGLIFGFNDTLLAGDGDNVVVGDVYMVHYGSGSGSGSVDISIVAYGGGNYGGVGGVSVIDVFNDSLEAGDGDDTLVGDVYFIHGDDSASDADLDIDVAGYGEGVGGSGFAYGGFGGTMLFKAFNDHLNGGNGHNVIVGDVYFETAGSEASMDISIVHKGEGKFYGHGGDGEYTLFNDTIISGSGNDLLVGDVYYVSDDDSGSLDIDVAGYGGGAIGASGGDSTFDVFNDTITADAGNDVVVGDVYMDHDDFSGSVDIDIFAKGGGKDEGYGGDVTIRAFNDHLDGGLGANLVVGDVYLDHNGSGGNVYIDVTHKGIGNAGHGGDSEIRAFNDTLIGGEGGDLMVGDVYLDHDDSSGSLDIQIAAYGGGGDGGYGGSTLMDLFNDSMTGGDGNDLMVGDLYLDHDGGYGDVDIEVFTKGGGKSYGYGGDAVIGAFNDTMSAGAGDDLLVGDVYMVHDGYGGSARITVSSDGLGYAGGHGGDSTLTLFNDLMDAGVGSDDTLVGDVYLEHIGAYGDVEIGIYAYGGGGDAGHGGDSNLSLFNDTMTGGDGDDVMVGDVLMYAYGAYGGGSVAIDVFAYGDGFDGHAGNAVVGAFNDGMYGGSGDDFMVGDVYMESYAYGNLYGYGASVDITVEHKGHGGGGYGGDATFHLFNDYMDAGVGSDDTLIGDIYFESYSYGGVYAYGGGSVDIDIIHRGGGGYGGYGGDSVFDLFNDTMIAGDGNDQMVGDIYFDHNGGYGGQYGGIVDINVNSYGGGRGEGHGGDVTVGAFNDDMDGGTGDDTMVGDIAANFHDYGGDIEITVFNGGPRNSAAGVGTIGTGDYDLFNDTMSGGAGNDLLIGDVALEDIDAGSGDEIDIEVMNKGFGYGGVVGTFDMFNDVMNAGPGDDTVIGDFGLDLGGFGRVNIYIDVDNVRTGPDDTVTGDFNLFNDSIDGGVGSDDLLIGDVGVVGSGDVTMDVDIRGSGGADFDMFNDTISGGDGDDTIIGDFGLRDSGSEMTLSGSDDGGGADGYKLFSDLLMGGAGDDVIFGDTNDPSDVDFDGGGFESSTLDGFWNDTLDGGTGADTLTGGPGDDVFVLRAGDGGATVGLADVITDFGDGADSIGLADGLTFAQLTIDNSGADAIVSITSTGEILASVTGVDLVAADFIVV